MTIKGGGVTMACRGRGPERGKSFTTVDMGFEFGDLEANEIWDDQSAAGTLRA
jgi:hypothetical protein